MATLLQRARSVLRAKQLKPLCVASNPSSIHYWGSRAAVHSMLDSSPTASPHHCSPLAVHEVWEYDLDSRISPILTKRVPKNYRRSQCGQPEPAHSKHSLPSGTLRVSRSSSGQEFSDSSMVVSCRRRSPSRRTASGMFSDDDAPVSVSTHPSTDGSDPLTLRTLDTPDLSNEQEVSHAQSPPALAF